MKFKNQMELFNYVWDNRPHVSEISRKPLLPPNHPQWHWQMAHILAKGQYTKWKLNPDNIMLMTIDEHRNQEQHPEFMERHEEMRRNYYALYYGKKFD